MASTFNLFVASVLIFSVFCSWANAKVDEQTVDDKKNVSATTEDNTNIPKFPNKPDGKYFNYLRLPDGQCFNCSTYKCTTHKANLGGSEWCIMLFSDAITHCDSDPNCGGYTMSTADWFHKQHDKKGQVAVHLNKVGGKTITCPVADWSSYEKQTVLRDSPIIYGRSTCGLSQPTCDKPYNFNYQFASNSVVENTSPYLCKGHPNSLDEKDAHCILPISDGIAVCNSDNQCAGFLINTDVVWQKKYLNNGMQAVQLFGQGATYTPNQNWRTFGKQY